MTKRATGVVTAADVIAGYVSLDISCLDRLYLTGFVPKLQTPGRVIYFLHDHLGNPITSPAIFEQIGNRFRAAIRGWAQVNNIPMIRFGAGDRKADVMASYLATAADAGCSQVVAVGLAQECAQVWTATKRDTDPGKCPHLSTNSEPDFVVAPLEIRASSRRSCRCSSRSAAFGSSSASATGPVDHLPWIRRSNSASASPRD